MIPPPPVGAHVMTARGLARGGLSYADSAGARAVQVFVGNPRGWALSDGDPQQDAAFLAGCAERGIPSFVHTPFLVNVGAGTQPQVGLPVGPLGSPVSPHDSARIASAASCVPFSAVGHRCK